MTVIVAIPHGWTELWQWAYHKYMLDLTRMAARAQADGKPLKLDARTEQGKACVWASRYVANKAKELK